MNIYLDVDGVLLEKPGKAANFADDFLQFILAHYPNTTYWLTMRQWQGQDKTVELLKPVLSRETKKLMPRIKPTNWHDWKTDAVDFMLPFLWFESNLYPQEQKILQEFSADKNVRHINLAANPDQLMDEIIFMQALPA